MSGKRIAREKLTIQKMIALYQNRCPEASTEEGHYDALFAYAQNGWINAYLAKRNQLVSSARCTVISQLSVRR